MSLTANDLPARNVLGHCPIDALNKTCEKFFQIWSHKAANLSNDLIEYTIRRIQSDRLRFLFQTRNEYNHQEKIQPICQISIHMDDDLQRIKEHIRRFCLSTRNVYRHLRSDSRIYPMMSIDIDQGIMIKICRFIFKAKVLIKIFSKQQHMNEQLHKHNDSYRNITKAFIVLQSNFEILFGDILDKDVFQNAKTAVRILPVVLDVSKTIRLIFCAIYKLSEPERQAKAETNRQRRLALCVRGYGSKKQEGIMSNAPIENDGNRTMKTRNEIPKMNQRPDTFTSTVTPAKTLSPPPSHSKTLSNEKSTNQPKTKTLESPKTTQPSKSQLNNRLTTASKTDHTRPSPSSPHKRKNDLSKKSSTKDQKKTKSSSSKNHQTMKIPKNKNRNASATDSTSSIKYHEDILEINNNYSKDINISDQYQTFSAENTRWTTWLHNATLCLSSTLESDPTDATMWNIHRNPINNRSLPLETNSPKPLLTTWASLDRISREN